MDASTKMRIENVNLKSIQLQSVTEGLWGCDLDPMVRVGFRYRGGY